MKYEDESYLDNLLKDLADNSVEQDSALFRSDENSFQIKEADFEEINKQSKEFDEIGSLEDLEDLEDFSLDMEDEIELDGLESFDDLEYLDDLAEFDRNIKNHNQDTHEWNKEEEYPKEEITENLLEKIQQDNEIHKESSFEENLMEELFAQEGVEQSVLSETPQSEESELSLSDEPDEPEEAEELSLPDVSEEPGELNLPDMPEELEELSLPDMPEEPEEPEELSLSDIPQESEDLNLSDIFEEAAEEPESMGELLDSDNSSEIGEELNMAGEEEKVMGPDGLEEDSLLGDVENLIDLLNNDSEDILDVKVGGIGNLEEDNLLNDAFFLSDEEAEIEDLSLNADGAEDIGLSEDLLNMVSEEPESSPEGESGKKKKGKKKKNGKEKNIWQRLFGNVHDEKAKKPPKQVLLDENGNPIEKVKKTKEEKKKEQEQKKKEQEELKKEKDEKKAAAKTAKETKKKEKEEAKKAKVVEEVVEDEGRINRMGAFIVFCFFGVIAFLIVRGANSISYSFSIDRATEDFVNQEYNSAYNEIRGLEIKDKDLEIHDKIMTVMFVNKQLNSYNNYYELEMYPQALDSLLKGLQRYDEYLSLAKELGIKSDLDYVRNHILDELKSIYGLSEISAYYIIESDDQEIYSQKVMEAASLE